MPLEPDQMPEPLRLIFDLLGVDPRSVFQEWRIGVTDAAALGFTILPNNLDITNLPDGSHDILGYKDSAGCAQYIDLLLERRETQIEVATCAVRGIDGKLLWTHHEKCGYLLTIEPEADYNDNAIYLPTQDRAVAKHIHDQVVRRYRKAGREDARTLAGLLRQKLTLGEE